MGVVKYTGPIASFHCPTNAEIRSLKVHFSPKQEGTGDPSPENIRPIVGWNGVEVYNNNNGLPKEYQQVKYIERNEGGAIISIDYQELDMANCEIYATFTILGPASGERAYMGASATYGRGNAWEIYFPMQKWRAAAGSNQIIVNGDITTLGNTGSIHIIMDDISRGLTLGQYRYGAYQSSNRIHYCRIEKNGSILREMFPCYRKLDNKPGMYDIVTNTFYINTGLEEFICGPDVGKTTDYEFGVLGKNKLSDNLEDYILSGAPADINLSNGTFSGTVNEGYRDVAICTPNHKYPAGTYTLSFDYINNVGNVYWKPVIISTYNNSSWYYSLVGTDSAAESSGHYVKTFTANEDFYINLSLNCFDSAKTTAVNSISNLQLELGSTATTYEPYDPKHTVYGGWVDLISGEVHEEKIKHIVASNGFYTSGRQASVGGVYFYKDIGGSLNTSTTPGQYAAYNSHELYSHGSPSNPYGDKSQNCGWIYKSSSTKSTVRLGFTDEMNITTIEELYNWIDNNENEISIVYPLETPNTYHLSPTQLQTFLGQNNIWSNADYVEVEYDLHETQDILARKQFIIANQPHIEAPTPAALQSFTTNMVAPLKECKVYFEPIQEGSGDASPSNVRAISGWTGLEITKCGKNTANILAYHTAAGAYYSPPNSTNYYERTTTGFKITPHSGSEGLIFNIGQVLKNTQYGITFNINGVMNRYRIVILSREGNISEPVLSSEMEPYASSWIYDINQLKSFSVPISGYLGLVFHQYASTPSEFEVSNLQLEKLSNQITSYEPYTGTTVPLDWTSSAGTIHGGYVDLVNEEVVEEWHKIVADGVNVKANSKYVSNSGKIGGGIVYLNPHGNHNDDSLSHTTVFCDTLPTVGQQEDFGNKTKFLWCARNGKLYVIFFLFNASDYEEEPSTQEVIDMTNAWLQEHPTSIVYKLDTPIHYQLSSQTLKTLRGTNNIWSTANGNIELKYWTH